MHCEFFQNVSIITLYLSVSSPNAGKYGQETPIVDILYAASNKSDSDCQLLVSLNSLVLFSCFALFCFVLLCNFVLFFLEIPEDTKADKQLISIALT